jgi:hypothetical protein
LNQNFKELMMDLRGDATQKIYGICF